MRLGVNPINIIIVKDGVVDDVCNFHPDNAQGADAKFVEACTLTANHQDLDISAADLDQSLNRGCMQVGTTEIFMSPPC